MWPDNTSLHNKKGTSTIFFDITKLIEGPATMYLVLAGSSTVQ